MIEAISWLLFIAFIVGLITLAAMLVRGYVTGGKSVTFGAPFFPAKPPTRLKIVEEANIDGRRKLLIVRRDSAEHLIMIGGPVDIVIENNLQSHPEPRLKLPETAPAAPRMVHSAPQRAHAVGE